MRFTPTLHIGGANRPRSGAFFVFEGGSTFWRIFRCYAPEWGGSIQAWGSIQCLGSQPAAGAEKFRGLFTISKGKTLNLCYFLSHLAAEGGRKFGGAPPPTMGGALQDFGVFGGSLGLS